MKKIYILLLLTVVLSNLNSQTIIENGEDNSTTRWRVVDGGSDDIVNIYDSEIKSRVIEFKGGGSYRLGATAGDGALNIKNGTTISWKMRTTIPYTIYILVQTKDGLRYLFYVSTPSRGLKHGFTNGVHHGLGKSTIDGRWRTITRDLSEDLKDAEPNNKIVSINGIIISGGNGIRVDDITLYTPEEKVYKDGYIDVNNSYKLDINSENFKILEWRFKDFGTPEILDKRGIIRDKDVFEFRVHTTTTNGKRDLIYTLGQDNLGLIEDNRTIHHALGDDRAIGSVWVEDYPKNSLGMPQGITRDLDEDIRDFEPNNHLLKIDSFEVKGSGSVGDIKLISKVEKSNSYTCYEDGEDGKADGWRVIGDGKEARNRYSPSLDSRVIKLEGRGGPWILGTVSSSGDSSWHNRKEKYISWKMFMGSRYTVYIPVTTKNGTRYLFYNDLPKRILRHGFRGGILHGLGGYGHSEYKHVWRTYTRDLEADLKDSEPDNELISVNGFIYSGADASLDDILLYNPNEIIYEDGTTPDRWIVSDNSPDGATVTSIDDPQGEHVQGKVIELKGSKLDNAYRLNFSNSKYTIIQWKSRFYERYSVSLIVQTKKGERELLYTNSNGYRPSGGLKNNGYTIWHEMGGRSLIGQNGWEQRRDFGAVNNFWQSVTRDLNQDIKDFERDNEYISISSFEVRGSGLIDDIKMLSRPTIIKSKENIVYEDAEDGNIDGWSIFSNESNSATITNIFDEDRGSRVISLHGVGKGDGYMLGTPPWNNIVDKNLKWSMRYGEDFTIYISVQTKNGKRYLTYTPIDNDRGLKGSYIRLGLGSNIIDNRWHTFRRNLNEDIKSVEPNNELTRINSFRIRGTGFIDDIEAF